MRFLPTPSPLRQDLSATTLEIPLETHLRSLILRNNPQILNSQSGESSRPKNENFTDEVPPANIPALPPKGTRAQRNNAPTTQGMAYHRFGNPQQQNRSASDSRTHHSQQINNSTGHLAPAAYSLTPPPPGLDAQKTYGQRTDGSNNYYRQGRVPPQPRQMNYSNERPRHQFQGRDGNPNRSLHDHHTARASQNHRYGHGGGGNQTQWSDNPARDQVNYLQRLAIVEVPNAEMRSEEATRRENLRLHLERICSETIYQFELEKDKNFDASSVQLKCFGSLSSGFATWSSDMDLALLSPLSVPDSSSRDSEIPRLLEKTFLDLGYGARLLTRTRVPIIKFCEEPTPNLAKSLLDERQKYEHERDAPPKPKPKKVEKEKKIRKGKDTEDGAKDGLKEGSMERLKVGPSPAIPRESGLGITTKVASCSTKNEGSQENILSSNKENAEINTQVEERLDYEANETPVSSAEVDKLVYSVSLSVAPLAIIDDPEGNLNCEAKDKVCPLTGRSLTDSPLMNNTTSGTKDTSEYLVNAEENNDSIYIKPACSRTEVIEANCKAKDKIKDVAVALVKEGEAADEDEVVRPDNELVFLYTLAMNEGWYNAEERKIIKCFVTAVKLQASGAKAASLDRARLKLKDLTKILHRYRVPPENNLDFPKTGVGVQCDINFSNPLALHNTLLLRCYSHSDPRVRPMIIFVKSWAKKRKINSPYHGTLSSYGYVLMVLHYLINVANPPILLNLQTTKEAAEDRSPHNDHIIDGYTVRFWRSENEIIELARSGCFANNTRDNVGSLLRGFFHYYAQQGYYSPQGGFCWPKDIISIRTNGGIIPKNEKGWTEAKTITIEPTNVDGDAREIKQRYLLAIEDPFEIDHNIARTVVYHGVRAIRDEFQRAHGIVQNVGPGVTNVDLLAEAPDRENSNRRFFGPLPRKGDLEMKNDEKSKMRNSPKDKKSGTDNEKMGLGDLAKERKGDVENDKEASSSEQKSCSSNSRDKRMAGAAPQEKGSTIQPPRGPRKPSGRRQSKAVKLPVGEEPKEPSNKLPPHLRVPLEGSSAQEQRPALQLGVPPRASSLALPDQVLVVPSRHDLDSMNISAQFPVEGQASAVSRSPADTITGSTARPMSHDSATTISSSLETSSIADPNIRIRTNLSHVYFY